MKKIWSIFDIVHRPLKRVSFNSVHSNGIFSAISVIAAFIANGNHMHLFNLLWLKH